MRRTARLAVAALLAVISLASFGTPASAAGTPSFRKYVALGDSYTAGPLIPWQQASWCFRSNNNYPAWLATKLGLYYKSGAFTDVSCSSADTTNMTKPQTVPSPSLALGSVPPQFEALTLDTDLVTIGIGGNDYGVFGSLVYTCPGLRDSDPTGSPCKDHFTINGTDTLLAAIKNTQRNLERVVKGVRERSPAATIVLVGYPRIVPPKGYCPGVVPFADGDYAWTDEVERALNKAVSTAARKQGARYVDTYGPSLGHDACAGDAAWVSGMDTDLFRAVAYHPYAAGMKAEADLIFKALGGTTAASTKVPDARNASTPDELRHKAAAAGLVPKS
ncbi:GDSL family lipase [Amycolatopsis orientalis]|uniref:GDSL family lipase n=1 Tax=Amycolatopsis orientalis TaxID=31958 RepID=A0A193C4K9_AMYOR|nr:SGNH/GDSL hydrolase family protein [Amycolatopsis orientalis]ANN19280.1 GDSL family lipase [Amycolatopsis orientalis]